jgi:hypothetical protein
MNEGIMRHVLLAIVVASFATGAAAQGSAPFCTVDNTGQQYQCYYYTLDSCRAAAGASGGCVANQQSRRGYDFGSGSVLEEMQRLRPPPAPTSSPAPRQRWLDMCRDMEQSYFNDLQDIQPRLSPPLTTEEYARLSSRFRERGEYCRALARQ